MSLQGKTILVFNPDTQQSGKSTIALLLANYIHNTLKQETLLISCDPIRNIQKRDAELLQTDMMFKKLFNQTGRRPILSILETGESNVFHLLHEIRQNDDSTIIVDCKEMCNERVLAAIDAVADFVIIPTDISQFAYKFGCFYTYCFNLITESRQKYLLLRNQVTADSQIDYPTEMYLHNNIKDLEYSDIIGYHPDTINDAHQHNTYFENKNGLAKHLPKLIAAIGQRI